VTPAADLQALARPSHPDLLALAACVPIAPLAAVDGRTAKGGSVAAA